MERRPTGHRAGRLPRALLALPIWLLPATAILACRDRAPETGTVVRDSLGIAIVETRRPAWTDGTAWSVSPQPVLQIGTVDGPPELQFHRVEGARRLEDGRIAVADAGSSEIRFFDRTGRFLYSRGRPGEAPGEYRQVTSIGRGPADSLWVYDFGLRRFTVLTASGDAVRTVSVGTTLSAVTAVGRLPDGAFVVKEQWSSPRSNEVRLGLVRDPVAVVRISADGSRSDTITTVAGREVSLGSEKGRGVMSAPLFAHTSSAALRTDTILVGDQASFEIRLYTPDGTLGRVFRRPGLDLRITADEVDRQKDALLAEEPDSRRVMARARLDQMDVPDTRPAFGRVVVDAVGNVWAAEYAREPALPVRWSVLDAGGAFLGVVEMPEGFRVLDIGSDSVLGVGRDAFDVEYIRLHRLEKPVPR